MDREEPEEGSSSQNVNLFIAGLRKRGAREETVTVALSDGSSFFIPVDWIGDVKQGDPVGEEELEKIRSADSYIRCKEWAAGFLAAKEESSGRLLQKMSVRGYDRETAKKVLTELQDLGFQDDQRFSEQWLRSRMIKHPESRTLLEAGLVQRGVNREIACDAVSENVSDLDEQDMLCRCLEKIIPDPSAADEKQIRRLIRRGFSYNAIKKNLAHDNGS